MLMEINKDETVLGAECSSLQGPTCDALVGPETPNAKDEDDAHVLRASVTKRSKVDVVRLDSIDDLLAYFKKHVGTQDLKHFALDGVDDATVVRQRMLELERLALVNEGNIIDQDSSDTENRFGGAFDGSLLSKPGLSPRNAVFFNRRDVVVELYWVDFAGREVHYVDIAPRHVGSVKTFQLHVWIVREKHTHAFISLYVVGDEDVTLQRFIVVADDDHDASRRRAPRRRAPAY